LLIEEARWLGDQLRALDPEAVSPLLDVGSSTAQFRTRDQPWIDELIFAPARAAGHQVVHLDVKAAEGVDLVADLSDRRAIAALAGRGFKSLICSNLLEHVDEPRQVAASLAGILPTGGYIFASGPYRYPLHPDPMDNMFRPTPDELAGTFPGTRLVAGTVVTDGSYLSEISRTPLAFLRLLLRLLLPFYKHAAWQREAARFVRYLPWSFRRFQASCVVLVRER
jgi:SAM-dependent methyltransferase